MNKTLPFIFSFSVFALSMDVQAQEPNSLWVTANAGICSSLIINQNAYGNGELDYATTIGYAAGLGVDYFISDKWGVNSSVSLAKLGQHYRGTQSGGEAIRKVNLDYIELPLLVMRRIVKAKKTTWIAFGPEFMFLISAKQEYHRTGGSPLPEPDYLTEGTTDIKERFKPVDLAFNFSLFRMFDLNYRNRNLLLLMSANMALGLTDINSNDWHTPNMHGDYAGSHNFYIGIRAGLMYKAFVK